MGEVDQGTRGGAPDAAVAHRQERRHSGVQERSIADRSRDRDDHPVGGRWRADGRSEGHAAGDPVARRRGLELRQAVRRSTRSRRQVAVVHPARARAGRLGQALDAVRRHRTALGARHRNSSRHQQGSQNRPPRARPAVAGRCGRQRGGREQRRRQRRHRRSRTLHGMGGRQAGRDHAPRHRQAAAARFAVRLGHSLLRGRRGDHQQRRARDLLLPERPGAKVPSGPAPHGHRRHRHSAEHGQGHSRLLRHEAGGARRELPAAHASARQGDDDGSDSADRRHADAEPRRQLQLQLAQQLLLRRRCGAPTAEGHGAAHHGVARQHRGEQVQPGSEPMGGFR